MLLIVSAKKMELKTAIINDNGDNSRINQITIILSMIIAIIMKIIMNE